jgi:hypothetical protein
LSKPGTGTLRSLAVGQGGWKKKLVWEWSVLVEHCVRCFGLFGVRRLDAALDLLDGFDNGEKAKTSKAVSSHRTPK